MDDAFPDRYGSGGGDTIHLVCEYCGAAETYDADEADDGFFTCRQCAAVHTSTQTTAADPADFSTYPNISLRRHAPNPPTTPTLHTPTPYPNLYSKPTSHPPAGSAAFDDYGDPNGPRDFAPGTGAWGDTVDLASGIRWRYVRGLQVMLQQQVEVLVERFRVSALVCGVAGSVWLRWVAASKVFDEMWEQKVLEDAEAADREKRRGGGVEEFYMLVCIKGTNLPEYFALVADDQKPLEVKLEFGWKDDNSSRRKEGRRIEFIFLRALRKMLPVYSTLAVCFLACHISREVILPSDIYRWAMEGKLPYVAVFAKVDKLLGSSMRDCPLDARQLFRPVRVIGAWQLEAAAGSIAQSIGLQLPSVNFYAIAHRCLNELSLPVERILPHACRIYEWAMPAELWLSGNPARVPTRVCVMSILIVTLRIVYNINGQGLWENISETGGNAGGSDPDGNSLSSKKPVGNNSVELCTRELLCTIQAAYDRVNTTHDYSKDLHSYLKYCKDVIFSGITFSVEEEHLIDIFWDMYKGREDENPKVCVKSELHDLGEMRTTDGVSKRCHDKTSVDSNSFPALRNDALEMIKSEMEDHGFYYMPPRKQQKSDGYVHYRRKRQGSSLVYVAHADYYILLRAFAKLAEVDVRIMHTSVLKLERKLAWIEQQTKRSLNTLQNREEGEGKGKVSTSATKRARKDDDYVAHVATAVDTVVCSGIPHQQERASSF